MPLDFLQFPYPARKNLVDQMSDTDLVRVSLQSQRTDLALRECGKNGILFYDLNRSDIRELSEFDRAELFLLEAARQGSLPEWPIKLSAEVSKEICFKLRSPYYNKNFHFAIEFDLFKNIDSYSGVRKDLMIGDHHVPIIFTDKEKLISFWNNKATGLITVLQFFSETYGLPVGSLDIHGCENSDHSTNIRRIVRASSQLDIREASVSRFDSEFISEDDYTFIMENITVNGIFRGSCKTSDDFQFDMKINAKSISINYGHWFELEHLLSSKDYEKIWVDDSRFTKDEVQMFLREWKAGEFPKLKYLTVDTNMENPLDALEGFEQYERQKPHRGLQRRLVELVRTSIPYIKGCGQYYGRIEVELFSALTMEVYHVDERHGSDSEDEDFEDEEEEEEEEGEENEEDVNDED